MADTVGMQDIRGLNVTKAVTGFALANYVFKDRLCLVQSSSSWQERYYQESASDLSASGTGNSFEDIPRLANFPHGEVSWTQQNSYHRKFGAETRLSYEDIISNDVDVLARSLLRIGRAIAKAVDAEIWDVITESRTVVNITSLTIAAGKEWDAVTLSERDPIKNILDAKVQIALQNYDPEGAFLCLSPQDYANLLSNANVRNAGQFYTSSVTERGEVGQICGLRILVSPNVTADYAAIVIGKEAATWKELAPLQTRTMEDAGIGTTIRAWEIGVCQLKNPKAVCLIINTQA